MAGCRSKVSRSSARPARKCRWQRTVQRKSSQRRKVEYSSVGEYRGLRVGLAQAIAIKVFGEPMQGVQIAQAALAVLDVGLDAIARVTGALVALVALGQLGLDKLARRAAARLRAGSAG